MKITASICCMLMTSLLLNSGRASAQLIEGDPVTDVNLCPKNMDAPSGITAKVYSSGLTMNISLLSPNPVQDAVNVILNGAGPSDPQPIGKITISNLDLTLITPSGQNATVVIPKGIDIVGAGNVTLTASSGPEYGFISGFAGSSPIKMNISNINIDGNQIATRGIILTYAGNSTITCVSVKDTTINGILLNGSGSNLSFSNVISRSSVYRTPLQDPNDGIGVIGDGNVITQNYVVESGNAGIMIYGGSNNEIKYNVVANSRKSGISTDQCVIKGAPGSPCVTTRGGQFNNIHDNQILNPARNGIELFNEGMTNSLAFSDIWNNWIDSAGEIGITVDSSQNSQIYNNHVLRSGAIGVLLFNGSSGVAVQENALWCNGGPTDATVFLDTGTSGNDVTDNDIETDSSTVIYDAGSGNVTTPNLTATCQH